MKDLQLTCREVEVALGVAKGMTCYEIAESLDLCYESIRALMKRLRDKTGIRRKPQLSVWATKNYKKLQGQLRRKLCQKARAV
jgi:DNA-binding CsgD family transcriptional regulator